MDPVSVLRLEVKMVFLTKRVSTKMNEISRSYHRRTNTKEAQEVFESKNASNSLEMGHDNLV